MIKGSNPVEIHDEYEREIKTHFEKEYSKQGDRAKICWYKEKQEGDNRDCNVVNYAYLISPGKDLDFFRSMTKSLLDYRKSVEQYKPQKNNQGEENQTKVNNFSYYLKEILKKTPSVKYLSSFLHEEEDELTNFLIETFTDLFQSLKVNGFEPVNQIFKKICPYATLAACLLIALWSYNRSKKETQRRENYISLLSNFYQIIISNRGVEEIMKSNVFIYSIDKRDYSSFNPFPPENHGSFCGFYHYNDLKGAPKGKDFAGKALIGVYREIYSDLFYKDTLDFESLNNFLDGTKLYKEISIDYESQADNNGCNIN